MQNETFHLKVNLKQTPEEGMTSVFLKWAVNSGRIIIVFVELLTLSALGFRFYVDHQIVDLHELIQTDQKFITRQTGKEQLYRSLQNRLSVISNLETQNKAKIEFLKQLTILLNSNDFGQTSLTFSNNTIGINGKTYSIFTLNTLVDKLKTNQNVTSISIDEISSLEQGIEFRLTTELKQSEASI